MQINRVSTSEMPAVDRRSANVHDIMRTFGQKRIINSHLIAAANLALCAILLASCSKGDSTKSVTTNQNAQTIDSSQSMSNDPSAFDYRRHVEEIDSLLNSADIVLELVDGEHIQRLKPVMSSGMAAATLDNVQELLPVQASASNGLAIFIIPGREIISLKSPPAGKMLDDIILDVHDVVTPRGYQRFVVETREWGQLWQIFTNGLPTRSQVAEKKRAWMVGAEDWEKNGTNADFYKRLRQELSHDQKP